MGKKIRKINNQLEVPVNIIATKNTAIQTLAVGDIVNLGITYRRYDDSNNCGVKAYTNNSTSITLNQSGMYHVIINITISAPAAGNVTLQLFENGVAIPGAIITETIATAATEFHTSSLNYEILVDSTRLLCQNAILPQTLTLVNTGIASTVTNVLVHIDKEV